MKVIEKDRRSFERDHLFVNQFAESPQPFYDMWERWMKQHPANLGMVHHRGSRSYAELFKWHPDTNKMGRIDAAFADFGTQLPEDIFQEFYLRALSLTEATKEQPNPRVLLVRYDHELLVPETWMNAPYRAIEGHSWHKIPQHQLKRDCIEDPIHKLWNTQEYWLAYQAGTLPEESILPYDDIMRALYGDQTGLYLFPTATLGAFAS